MSDPRFFRKYLDILGEQPVTANIDDNTSATVDPAAKTIGMQTKVGDNLNLQATQDLKAHAGTMSADLQVDPNTSVGLSHTQTGYKGQMAPSSQIRASYKDTSGSIGAPGQTHNVRVDKGVGFGGAGKNIQPGQNIQTTYTKT
jgi:hypothetical protein